MTDWFLSQSYVMQALLATTFTWLMTALGAGMVFFFKTVSRKLLDMMLGFAAGVMIAASFWSLLAPAIEMESARGGIAWVPAVVGFLLGAGFLRLADQFMPHQHPNIDDINPEGIKTKWSKSTLFILAMTLHNIPEGLAVGVAFGALAIDLPSATMAGAVALAIGIGIQNFPEGFAVSVPLLREGKSKMRAFTIGQLSGIVEIGGGVIGALAVTQMQYILPYALSFAAGAMIYVVVEELIPESQNSKHSDIATMGTIFGFVVMMLLDVALG